MALVFRWLFRLFLLLCGLSAGALTLVYFFAASSLPNYDARRTVTGISAELEIVRDNANVPHILGQTDTDSFFGLGYVHAQDRLWQMMLMRRTAQGRLSELFGPRTAKTDELMRRLDIYNLARASAAEQDRYAKEALDAYARGVNARIEHVNAEGLGRGAPEFFAFPPEIAPWTASDSIAIAKVMAVQLSAHLRREVLRARTSLILPEERLRDILPDVPGAGITALPDYAELVPGAAGGVPEEEHTFLAQISPIGLEGASNAWAAAPSRSAKTSTLLATDPHLGLTAPTVWYLARLKLQSGDVIGATIPGMPAVMVGRSSELGWGLTSAYMDDQDVFIEKLNPENSEEYLTPDGFKSFETRQSIIRINGEAPLTITLRWSDNGPILPGSHYGLETITPKGHVTALGWTMLTGQDTSLTAALRIMKSQSVGEAIEAGELFIAPAQNLILADRDSIGIKLIGAMPRRAARHQSKGRIPAPGWRPENRWQGRLGYAANPGLVDPEGGILGNTNNKMVDRPFPLHVSHDWGDTQRVQRWQRLMESRQVHTRESF
ncbi:MAG: penicillin acylase family protein, partial [Pseudomonadota bacterium]